MDPNPNYNPPTSSPPPGQFDSSQFDFIMNTGQKPRRSILPSGSPKQRLIIYIILGAIGLLAVIMLYALLFAGGDPNTEKIVSIAKQQNEIIRVANIGNRKATGQDTKKLAALTASTVSSDQKQTIDYLSKLKRKINQKELNASTNKENDAALTAAEQNGRFDEVFKDTLTELLIEYRSDLQSVQPNLGSNGKELFEKSFRNVSLILSDNK